MGQERLDLSHRHHRIIAQVRKGKAAAVVCDHDSMLHKVEAPSLDAAVDGAKAWVDQRVDGEKVARRAPHVGTADEYRRAFRGVPVSKRDAAMLRAHANAPKRTITAAELAEAGGSGSSGAADVHYGKLGRKVAQFMQVQPTATTPKGEPVWTMTLADGADEGDDGAEERGGRWAMHPEVAEALATLKMA